MTATSSPRQTLQLGADLRLTVTAPDGRSAEVLVEDDGGTVRVVLARAADLGVVRASLPGGLRGPGSLAAQLARLVRRGTLALPAWDQPVEVVVGSAVLLRRRGGRWSTPVRPGARTVAAGVLVVLGLAVATRLRRR
jgi:hypothetical protein